MLRLPRAVLFDFGHTLFAHPPLAATIVEAGRRVGRRIDNAEATELAAEIDRLAHLPAEIARGRDLDAAVWAQRFGVLYRVADDHHPGLGEQIYDMMHAADQWVPYPATATTLAALNDRKIPIGVVSNTGWDVRTVFVHHGLADLIDQFILSCEVGAVKPDAKIFHAALDALGVAADEALMVGDDPLADVGAQRVGLATLLVPPRPPGSDNGVGIVASMCF